MAVRDDLIEAFNDCLDRVNRGEPVEAILRDYPALAAQLRPMLEAGLLFPRVRVPAAAVNQAADALEPLMRQSVQQTFRGGRGGLIGRNLILLLIGGGLIIGAALLTNRDRTAPPAVVPLVETRETSTPTLTLHPTTLATLTETPTVTPEPSVTVTASPTLTVTVTVSTHTPTPLSASQITLEGPVSAINGSTITIYGMEWVLDSDDPALSVLQVGDVIRITAVLETGSLQIISVAFVDVLVVIRDGMAWRGDDCGAAPPAWAASLAGAWYEACRRPSVPSGGGQAGSSHNNDDDDDDD